MSTPSTRITTALAEIKALCEKATPGPWKHDGLMHGKHTVRVIHNGHNSVAQTCLPGKEHDAAFIAASRETIERLVTALEHAVSVCENVDAIHKTESLKAIADKLTGGKP